MSLFDEIEELNLGSMPSDAVTVATPSSTTCNRGDKQGARGGCNSATPEATKKPLPATKPAKQEPAPDYALMLQLMRSGSYEDFWPKIESFDAAMFAFALNTVWSCPAEQFMAMGQRYCPYWRQRLEKEAWRLVAKEIRQRLDAIEAKAKAGDSEQMRLAG